MVPPYDEKSEKIVKQLFLIAQKERPDALNAMQKTPALDKVWFLKKSRITSKNYHVLTKTAKNGFF